ncbi:MAG: HAMP domain-containing protein [Verrucomicrobia bacterium]|nr:HAMP domain-containing protein [Verrucomicrobiota bacterium]
MFIKSIRWRLQVWHGLLLLTVLITFGYTAHHLVLDNRLRRVDQELQRRALPLAGMFSRFGRPGDRSPGRFRPGQNDGKRPSGERSEPGEAKPGEPREESRPFDGKRPDGRQGFGPDGPRGLFFGEFRLPAGMTSPFDEMIASGYYFVAWSREGDELRRSTNAPPEVSLPDVADVPDGALARTRRESREIALRTRSGSIVLVGHDIAPDLAELRRLAWLLSLAGGGVLLLGLAGGWWLATRALRPFEYISRAAVKIAGGDLAERIQTTDAESELGQLARVLNNTFDRLQSAFARQAQFTADAAHELRTPIAVLISEAQTTLARERAPGEYREAVEEYLAVAQQMRRLTESLLDLSRFDAGQESLRREELDLAQVVADSIALVRPLAESRGVKIFCETSPAKCAADSQRLNQVVTNLLTNAICYNKTGGEVRVKTRAEGNEAFLEIADTGAGILAEDLPHVFERFYRADKSRTRAEGHAGLGLAIVKAILDAHGGGITVASEPGKGSTFTVRLPRNGRTFAANSKKTAGLSG